MDLAQCGDDVIAIGALVAAATTLAICPPLISGLQRRAIMDVPGGRSLHTAPTPRGGGLAIVVGVCVGLLVGVGTSSPTLLIVSLVAVAFACLGLVDDLSTISVQSRLIAQFAVAAVGTGLLTTDAEHDVQLIVAIPLGAIWLVAYVNAFNFMDGINGISAVQAVVAGCAWGLVGLWEDETAVAAGGFVVAAASIAFVPFNAPQARVFLGDVGSYFLGAWLAALALVGLDRGFTIEMTLAPLMLYLCDTGATLVRRHARGAKLTEPHREHTYQRLVAGGWSHGQTALFVGLVIVLSSLLGAATMFGSAPIRVLADAVLVLLMAGYLFSPRIQARASAGSVGASTFDVGQ